MSTKPCKLTYVNMIYVYTELFSKNATIKVFVLELLKPQAVVTLKTLPSTDILQFFQECQQFAGSPDITKVSSRPHS